MTDSAMDNQALLRRTLVTATAMLGGCVLIVGTLTLIALAVVGHAVALARATRRTAGAATARHRAREESRASPAASPRRRSAK